MYQHLRGYKSSNGKFHRALRKHGRDMFVWDVLYQSLDRDHCLKVMEPHFIWENRSFESGYNMTVGGDGTLGHKMGAETLKKMSVSARNSERCKDARKRLNEHNRGTKRSDETRLKIKLKRNLRQSPSLETRTKMSSSMMGHRHTDEAKEKMRQKAIGRKMSDEAKEKIRANKIGRRHSEETKRKISEIVSGRIVSEETRIRMSAAKIGFRHSEDAKAKMSAAKKKKRKPLSEETKRKISEALRNRQ
jgi:hypothetical protein